MPVLLVRHGHALGRFDWDGPDRRRPLSSKGQEQAERLGLWLATFAPRRILSSPAVRCTQTAAPLAKRLGLAVEETENLAEGHTPSALHLLRELAGQAVVAMSHGDVIPEVLWALADHDGVTLPEGARWPKASTWALEGADGHFSSVRYLGLPEPCPPPERRGQGDPESREAEAGGTGPSAALGDGSGERPRRAVSGGG